MLGVHVQWHIRLSRSLAPRPLAVLVQRGYAASCTGWDGHARCLDWSLYGGSCSCLPVSQVWARSCGGLSWLSLSSTQGGRVPHGRRDRDPAVCVRVRRTSWMPNRSSTRLNKRSRSRKNCFYVWHQKVSSKSVSHSRLRSVGQNSHSSNAS